MVSWDSNADTQTGLTTQFKPGDRVRQRRKFAYFSGTVEQSRWSDVLGCTVYQVKLASGNTVTLPACDVVADTEAKPNGA